MRQWLEAGRDVLAAFMRENNQPAFRAGQVRDWLHGKRVDSAERMTNLPKTLRGLLAAHGVTRSLVPLERRDAADGLTAKWLFSAADALVETVLIIEKQLSRRTVCVSCMAGCPLGCLFCATGKHGYTRNLSAGEIIEQAYRADEFSRELGDGMGVSHIVFMGMGEPLLNPEAVLSAAAAFVDAGGLGLSGRHVTISTAGVPDGIRRLAGTGVNYRLALSLHAPNQRTREKIMPAARNWPLDELFGALEEFSRSSSRDVTFEYCLIKDVNASAKDADELADLLAGLRGKVNLIPLNPVPGIAFRPPPAGDVRRFQERLERRGIPVTVRMEKGRDIGAACGQLRAERET